MFYSQLPKNDFDSKKFECSMLHSYDSFMVVDQDNNLPETNQNIREQTDV